MSPSDRFVLTERDLLIQVKTELSNLSKTFQENNSNKQEELKDHEARIRILENFRWWIIGASAGAGFLGNMLGKIIFK